MSPFSQHQEPQPHVTSLGVFSGFVARNSSHPGVKGVEKDRSVRRVLSLVPDPGMSPHLHSGQS